LKTCLRCGHEKPLEDFHRQTGTSTGRASWCKPCVLSKRKERYKADPHARAVRLWNNARDRARKAGLDCTITVERIEQTLIAGRCELTGIPFRNDDTRGLYSASIDRINPSVGYTPENTQVILWGVNRAKSDGSLADVVSFFKEVAPCL
jgi:hypothetical protein